MDGVVNSETGKTYSYVHKVKVFSAESSEKLEDAINEFLLVQHRRPHVGSSLKIISANICFHWTCSLVYGIYEEENATDQNRPRQVHPR